MVVEKSTRRRSVRTRRSSKKRTRTAVPADSPDGRSDTTATQPATPPGDSTGAEPSDTGAVDGAQPVARASGAAAAKATEQVGPARKKRRAGRPARKRAKRSRQPPPSKSAATAVGEEPSTTRAVPAAESAAPPQPADTPRDRDPTTTAKPETRSARRDTAGRPRRRKPRKSPGAVQEKSAAAKQDTDGKAATDGQLAKAQAGKADESRTTSGDQPAREMLINASCRDECRIAVLHEGRLEELFIERESTQSHVGNIYKGRVVNVEPSIQAVFIDFGLPQNGFLHISDVQPQYFPDHKGQAEHVGRKIPRYNRPPIQKCFRRGQEVIVQVTKEGVGTKGPTLTTYLSIPGRFLVMMPGMNRHGVSRKIEDEVDRRTMRELLNELDLPSGMGFILRTAGFGQSKRELQRDLNYLMRLWKTVADRIKRLPAPTELYRESDLVTRTIRDVYTTDFKRLIVDDDETAKKAREFLQIAMPRSKAVVEIHSQREPLFHRFGIEDEIQEINMRHVPLPSGGSLVIDAAEALVAIDVNSGRFRTTDDAEETAFKINLEAAEEIARQLRLRDLGGLIVCDFIDMRLDRHKRAVEQALRESLKKHKERARILRTSAFGLIEMTRQRQGPALKRNIYGDCPHCKGTGQVKTSDSVALDVMRIIQLAMHQGQVHKVTVTVASDVAFRILNSERAALNQIEAETGKELVIRSEPGLGSDRVECLCEDKRGHPVNVVSSSR